MKFWFILGLVMLWCVPVQAALQLEAVYPYSLEQNSQPVVSGGSVLPLYLNLENHNSPDIESGKISVTLPEGFVVQAGEDWQLLNDGRLAQADFNLEANYSRWFRLLYIKAPENWSAGSGQLVIKVQGSEELVKTLNFEYNPLGEADTAKPVEERDYGWYIQSVTVPVDNYGQRDFRSANGVINMRDIGWENFRSRLKGDGSVSWSAVYNHPAAYLLLEMRNPRQDIRLLNFRAELLDKSSGEPVPGLKAAGEVNDVDSDVWQEDGEGDSASQAVISLSSDKMPSFILPLYIDYNAILPGSYTLLVEVSDSSRTMSQDVPLTITMRNRLGIWSVGIAGICLLVLVAALPRLRRWLNRAGAEGAVTTALFAAMAFGGITVPTTLFGDILQVCLGPFAGYFTGLLNGVMLYMLLAALVTLYRWPGTAALFLLVKFFLGALLFGHFSPLSVLSCAVSITFTELALWLSGFRHRQQLTKRYVIMLAVLLGIADSVITLINMEQIMFFYRLYYAEWYLLSYMFINGFIYSSIGVWLGCRLGLRLQQITGE